MALVKSMLDPNHPKVAKANAARAVKEANRSEDLAKAQAAVDEAQAAVGKASNAKDREAASVKLEEALEDLRELNDE